MMMIEGEAWRGNWKVVVFIDVWRRPLSTHVVFFAFDWQSQTCRERISFYPKILLRHGDKRHITALDSGLTRIWGRKLDCREEKHVEVKRQPESNWQRTVWVLASFNVSVFSVFDTSRLNAQSCGSVRVLIKKFRSSNWFLLQNMFCLPILMQLKERLQTEDMLFLRSITNFTIVLESWGGCRCSNDCLLSSPLT